MTLLLAGCNRDDFQSVSTGKAGAFEPDVAVGDDLVAVAWNDNRDGNDEIYLRLYSPELRAITTELRLTHTPTPSYEASIALLDNDIAIAWYERFPGGRLQTWIGLWDRNGHRAWQHPLPPARASTRNPVLRRIDGKLFAAWIEDDNDAAQPSRVLGAWLDHDGNTSPLILLGMASRTTWNLNAERWPDGRAAVVFDAVAGTRNSELWLALVDDARSTLTRLGADDGFDSKYPDLAVHGDTAALTWFDMKDGNDEVYLATFAVDHIPQGTLDTSAMRVTQTAGESIGAYLAWSHDTLGLAWCDNTSGNHEIFFQRFDPQGRMLAPARQVTHTSADSLIPSIKPLGRGFVLAWNEAVLADGGHDGDQGKTRSEVVLQQVE